MTIAWWTCVAVALLCGCLYSIESTYITDFSINGRHDRLDSFAARAERQRPFRLCAGSEEHSSIVDSLITFQTYEQPQPPVNWIIRPATVYDRDSCAALINVSFGTLLVNDYSPECLTKCLPLITSPREQLLTCNTWYVAEHPSTRQIVGCGGWTVRRPPPRNVTNATDGTLHGTNNASAEIPIGQPELIPQLRHFAVHPIYLRMGIASEIWKHTHSSIRLQFSSLNLSFPVLEVFSTLTAQSFYASLGFVSLQRVDFALSKDCVFPAMFMRRNPDE